MQKIYVCNSTAGVEYALNDTGDMNGTQSNKKDILLCKPSSDAPCLIFSAEINNTMSAFWYHFTTKKTIKPGNDKTTNMGRKSMTVCTKEFRESPNGYRLKIAAENQFACIRSMRHTALDSSNPMTKITLEKLEFYGAAHPTSSPITILFGGYNTTRVDVNLIISDCKILGGSNFFIDPYVADPSHAFNYDGNWTPFVSLRPYQNNPGLGISRVGWNTMIPAPISIKGAQDGRMRRVMIQHSDIELITAVTGGHTTGILSLYYSVTEEHLPKFVFYNRSNKINVSHAGGVLLYQRIDAQNSLDYVYTYYEGIHNEWSHANNILHFSFRIHNRWARYRTFLGVYNATTENDPPARHVPSLEAVLKLDKGLLDGVDDGNLPHWIRYMGYVIIKRLRNATGNLRFSLVNYKGDLQVGV